MPGDSGQQAALVIVVVGMLIALAIVGFVQFLVGLF